MIPAEVKADNTPENYKSVPPFSPRQPLEHLSRVYLPAVLEVARPSEPPPPQNSFYFKLLLLISKVKARPFNLISFC